MSQDPRQQPPTHDMLRPLNPTGAHTSPGNLSQEKQRANPTEQRWSCSKSCRTAVPTPPCEQEQSTSTEEESYRRRRPPPAPSVTHTGCHEEVNICMQPPHGGMRSSLSYLLALWGRAASAGTSGASVVPDGKLWHFHRHLQAATNAVRMRSTPQTMLRANETFETEKGVGHSIPLRFSSPAASLNSQPQRSPPSPSSAQN